MSETPSPQNEVIRTITNDSHVTLNGEEIQYQLVDSSNSLRDSFSISVENPTDQDEVNNAITDRLLNTYWFLSPEYRQGLKQRFRIQFNKTHGVDLYNFQDDELKEEDLATITNACSLLYRSLKDKNDWKLESIQILKKGEIPNRKVKDDPSMGMEFYRQHRFVLYPEAFDNENYFGIANCSWLKGVILHEGAHINLEQELSPLWEEHKEELGWEDVEDMMIQLPGGTLVSEYNREPLRCPTEYGQYSPDDDRADSVVRYLADLPTLDPVRANILSEILLPVETISKPLLTSESSELPTCPPITIQVEKKQQGFIKSGSIRRGSPPSIVDLETFRQEHGIAA